MGRSTDNIITCNRLFINGSVIIRILHVCCRIESLINEDNKTIIPYLYF